MKFSKALFLSPVVLLLVVQCSSAQVTASQRAVHGRETASVGPLTLWYRAPAQLWTDALSIGNGRLGAMIFGAPENDRFQLNDITVSRRIQSPACNP
jgi:hypothetical protein